jgi:hypothetical protein
VKHLAYGFGALSAANFLAVVAALFLWVWDGDGRWGWTALLCLILCGLSALMASGFSGVHDRETNQ